MKAAFRDPYLPYAAQIMQRRQDTPDIFTLGLRFANAKHHRAYQFQPGQFNMLYLFGVGEVPISIVTDPQQADCYYHTIHQVGQVTNGLAQLQEGDCLGVRGPYGVGWPLQQAIGKDVLVITGGLGCAPSVSAIHHLIKHRSQYKKILLLQGVKHSSDLLFRSQYEQWAQLPDTHVFLAANKVNQAGPHWPWLSGYVTEFIPNLAFDPSNVLVMMCGPEAMLQAALPPLQQKGVADKNIYINMERNMECALGHCGHCQFGGQFVCKNGPVFCYPVIKNLFGKKGF